MENENQTPKENETILTGNVTEPPREVEQEVKPDVPDDGQQMQQGGIPKMQQGKMPLPAEGFIRSIRA